MKANPSLHCYLRSSALPKQTQWKGIHLLFPNYPYKMPKKPKAKKLQKSKPQIRGLLLKLFLIGAVWVRAPAASAGCWASLFAIPMDQAIIPMAERAGWCKLPDSVLISNTPEPSRAVWVPGSRDESGRILTDQISDVHVKPEPYDIQRKGAGMLQIKGVFWLSIP